MQVQLTNSLTQRLKTAGLNPTYLIDRFSLWKKDWPKYEYTFYDFGKDGGLREPLVKKRVDLLRHVHLCPTADKRKKRLWDYKFKEGEKRGDGSKRTSDRMLLYAVDGNDYLLIAILPEPTAHDVLNMKTDQDIKTMNYIAYVAEEFIDNRKIIN